MFLVVGAACAKKNNNLPNHQRRAVSIPHSVTVLFQQTKRKNLSPSSNVFKSDAHQLAIPDTLGTFLVLLVHQGTTIRCDLARILARDKR